MVQRNGDDIIVPTGDIMLLVSDKVIILNTELENVTVWQGDGVNVTFSCHTTISQHFNTKKRG